MEKKVIYVGYGKSLGITGFSESDNKMFPSGAQIQLYDEGDEPFEDSCAEYFDLWTKNQVDCLIEALKEVRESFPKG